jgi:hypothetical protein
MLVQSVCKRFKKLIRYLMVTCIWYIDYYCYYNTIGRICSFNRQISRLAVYTKYLKETMKSSIYKSNNTRKTQHTDSLFPSVNIPTNNQQILKPNTINGTTPIGNTFVVP